MGAPNLTNRRYSALTNLVDLWKLRRYVIMATVSTKFGPDLISAADTTMDAGLSARCRVAFYGRKNRADAAGLRDLGRQFAACRRVVGGRVFTRYFYDLPAPVDELLELAVHGAGGPPLWHGGWAELAEPLSTRERGFDAIVCADFERLSCRWRDLGIQREAQAAAYGVPIRYADQPWRTSRIAKSETGQLLNRASATLAEYRSTLTQSNRPADGR